MCFILWWSLVIFLEFVFIFIWKIEKQIYRHSCSIHDLFPKCLREPGLGQAGVRSLELHLCLPYGWQGHRYMSHHLQPSGMGLNRKLEQEQTSLDSREPLQCGMWALQAAWLVWHTPTPWQWRPLFYLWVYNSPEHLLKDQFGGAEFLLFVFVFFTIAVLLCFGCGEGEGWFDFLGGKKIYFSLVLKDSFANLGRLFFFHNWRHSFPLWLIECELSYLLWLESVVLRFHGLIWRGLLGTFSVSLRSCPCAYVVHLAGTQPLCHETGVLCLDSSPSGIPPKQLLVRSVLS